MSISLSSNRLHFLVVLCRQVPCLTSKSKRVGETDYNVNHLGLLPLHLLIFRNKPWLAIVVQDKVCVWEGRKESTMFHPGKGEAGGAAVEAAAAGLAGGGENHREEGEEEAEDWDEDEGNSHFTQIVFQVFWNPFVDPVPPSNICHAEAICDDA